MALKHSQSVRKHVRDADRLSLKVFIRITTTATGTSLNNRFNEQNKGSALRYKSVYISLPSSAKQQRFFFPVCLFIYLHRYIKFQKRLNTGITEHATLTHTPKHTLNHKTKATQNL